MQFEGFSKNEIYKDAITICQGLLTDDHMNADIFERQFYSWKS